MTSQPPRSTDTVDNQARPPHPTDEPGKPTSDQELSHADRRASSADQLNADSDQQSSDRDQAAADRDHAASTDLTPAGELAYGASRDQREAASELRLENQLGRAITAHDREMTGRFRKALEAGPNGVVAIDARGAVVYANLQLEQMFGYEPGTLLGLDIECLVPDDSRSAHAEYRRDFTKHPVARPVDRGLELVGRRRDGTSFPVEVCLSPIETRDGLQVFGTVADMTARKAADSRQLHAAKLESIGRLAAGIAHDFNNMLSVIQGYATVLSNDLDPDAAAPLDPANSLEDVKAILLAAERAANLTTQLLAFSRHQIVVPVDLDITTAVTVIEPLIRQLVGTDVNVDLHLDESAGVIRVDPGWVDQLVLNLIVNARDAMPDGGTVVIETGHVDVVASDLAAIDEVSPGPYVFVSVADTGIGIDRETREHMFEPYFTTKAPGQGTGLGLATTYGIVAQAGGHIIVESAPGHGATFKLLFPRMPSAAMDAVRA